MKPFADLSSRRILVVDDNDDYLRYMRFVLLEAGATVLTATSAAQAFEIACTGKVELIYCDLAMPSEDGVSFITRWRQWEVDRAWARIPCAAMSAFGAYGLSQDAVPAGYDVYLSKPVLAEEVCRIAADLLLGTRAAHAEGQARNEESPWNGGPDAEERST